MINLDNINKTYENYIEIIACYRDIKPKYKDFKINLFLIFNLSLFFLCIFFSFSISTIIILSVLSIYPILLLLEKLKNTNYIISKNKSNIEKIESKGWNTDSIKKEIIVCNKSLKNFYNKLKKLSESQLKYLNDRRDYMINITPYSYHEESIKEYKLFLYNEIKKEKISIKDLNEYLKLSRIGNFYFKIDKVEFIKFISKKYIEDSEKKEFLSNKKKMITIFEENIEDYKTKKEIYNLINNKMEQYELEDNFNNLKQNNIINTRNKVLKSI